MSKKDSFILIGIGLVPSVLVVVMGGIYDYLALALLTFGGAMIGAGLTALLPGSSFESSAMADIIEESMDKFKKELAEICKKERMGIATIDENTGHKTLLIVRIGRGLFNFRPLIRIDITRVLVQVDYGFKADIRDFDPRIIQRFNLEIALIKEHLSSNPTAA